MKQEWHVSPAPPEEAVSKGFDAFVSPALLAFVVIGALMYFRDELSVAGGFVAECYQVFETHLLVVTKWALKLVA